MSPAQLRRFPLSFTTGTGGKVHVAGYSDPEGKIPNVTICGRPIPPSWWIWEAEDKPYDVEQCKPCARIAWPQTPSTSSARSDDA